MFPITIPKKNYLKKTVLLTKSHTLSNDVYSKT